MEHSSVVLEALTLHPVRSGIFGAPDLFRWLQIFAGRQNQNHFFVNWRPKPEIMQANIKCIWIFFKIKPFFSMYSLFSPCCNVTIHSGLPYVLHNKSNTVKYVHLSPHKTKSINTSSFLSHYVKMKCGEYNSKSLWSEGLFTSTSCTNGGYHMNLHESCPIRVTVWGENVLAKLQG